MKNFKQFSEAKLPGNIGIPGEGEEGEKYISDVERRARRELAQVTGHPRDLMDLLMRATSLMIGDIVTPDLYFRNRLTTEQRNAVQARFSQIENLAKDVISSFYGDILDNVELNIKMTSPNEVKRFMDSKSDEPVKAKTKQFTAQEKEKIREIENLKAKIDKQKILNNIVQGEAKNTKNILHSEEVKSGLLRIFPGDIADQLFQTWDRTTKLANKMDWEIPIEFKARMMQDAPGGFAGAVSVEWKDMEYPDPDNQSEILDNLSTGEDVNMIVDELSDELSKGNPSVSAVGVDFPMLLHETVKGIYQLIASVAIPPDIDEAKAILQSTTSFEDEAEDFRYGPYIAADLRDFINKSKDVDKYPNIREFVFGEMASMNENEFLDLMKRILKSQMTGSDDPIARRIIDNFVSNVIETLDEYESQMIDVEVSKSLEEPSEEKMTKSDLQSAIDDALEEGDFEELDRLRKIYLKMFPN